MRSTTSSTPLPNSTIELTAPFDVEQVREDFPALRTLIHGKPLIYFDNAATSQKPRQVIDRIRAYYEGENANVHRGVHTLSQQATDAYEQSRAAVQRFINAPSPEEVIFTRGTSEAINLVASTFGRVRIGAGDEIVVSTMEHHSNIVPWQLLCEEKGARLRVIPITDDGEIIYDEYRTLLSDRVKLVAICHISNALGTVNPIREMIADAHALGIPVLVDGAQAVPHTKVDVQALGCDFYCFSGHKMFGPTGIGVLYGKRELLEEMPPWQGGGDMIERVSFEGTTFNELPYKFEAGTPNIADGIALATAIDYLEQIGMERIAAYEHDLLAYATERVQEIEGVRIVGTARDKAGVLSMTMEGIHPYDAGTILDQLGIAVRTGHHCTQPLMERLRLPGTIRASFAFYNTRAEVDALADGLRRVQALFS